jgi:hypothetical protein
MGSGWLFCRLGDVLDLFAGKADLAQDRVGVLSEKRCREVYLTRRRLEADCRCDLAVSADHGMLIFGDDAAV